MGQQPADTRPYSPSSTSRQMPHAAERQTLSAWCPDAGPVQRLCPRPTQVHMCLAGEDRGCPCCPRPPGLPIYQPLSIRKYINPEPVSIRVSIPGTVPDKPYLCAGALAPCSRACQSCCPHPACGVTLAETSCCVGRPASRSEGASFPKTHPRHHDKGFGIA